MKFSLAIFAAALSSAAASVSIPSGTAVKADSKMGSKLLSKARQLEDAGEEDTTWVSGYSLVFTGCHAIKQYNPEADGEDEVKIEEVRLARFRLCPVSSCGKSAVGCNSGYGDYIVNMDDFLATWYENKVEEEAEECEYYAENKCGCVDNGDDGYDEEKCLYDCYKSAGKSQCIDGNPYADDAAEEEEEFDVGDYLQCAQMAGGRRLEDAADDGNQEYYLGPYCSDEGSEINIGMFTDDTCTNKADDYYGKSMYKSMYGTELPYSSESIIDNKCYSCKQVAAVNDDGSYTYEASDTCLNIYSTAGKCEEKVADAEYPNENACSYIEGIQTIVRSNGIIMSGKSSGNPVAGAFIGIFTVSFVLLGAYTYFLKTKLDRGKINLSD